MGDIKRIKLNELNRKRVKHYGSKTKKNDALKGIVLTNI